MSDEKQQAQGSELSDLLGVMIKRLEREQFEKWLWDEQGLEGTWNETRNCFDEFQAHLAFKAWQARGVLQMPCRGARREGCSYLAPCGMPCDKCGEIH